MPIPCYRCRDGEPHELHRPDALAELRQLAIGKGLSPFLIEKLRRQSLLEEAVASVALDKDPRCQTISLDGPSPYECQHELHGADGGACPECGWDAYALGGAYTAKAPRPWSEVKADAAEIRRSHEQGEDDDQPEHAPDPD